MHYKTICLYNIRKSLKTDSLSRTHLYLNQSVPSSEVRRLRAAVNPGQRYPRQPRRETQEVPTGSLDDPLRDQIACTPTGAHPGLKKSTKSLKNTMCCVTSSRKCTKNNAFIDVFKNNQLFYMSFTDVML